MNGTRRLFAVARVASEGGPQFHRSQVTVPLPDVSTKPIEQCAPVKAVAEAISPRLADAALAAFVDGKMVDLAFPLKSDAKVQIVTNKTPEALELYRHSTAHLLAAAVTQLFPVVQCGIGPPIEDGFTTASSSNAPCA